MKNNSKLGLLNMFSLHHKLRLGVKNEVLMQQHGALVEVNDHNPTAAQQTTKMSLLRIKQQRILTLETFQTLQKKELLIIHRKNSVNKHRSSSTELDNMHKPEESSVPIGSGKHLPQLG